MQLLVKEMKIREVKKKRSPEVWDCLPANASALKGIAEYK